jgi:hypothetical protein
MSKPGIKPEPPRWEESTLEMRHSNSLLIAILERLQMSALPVENARDKDNFKVNC